MSVWFGVRFTPGGHSTFFGLLNTFVHIVMYFYYMVAAMGPQYQKFIWWKKYLTAFQMVSLLSLRKQTKYLFRRLIITKTEMWLILRVGLCEFGSVPKDGNVGHDDDHCELFMLVDNVDTYRSKLELSIFPFCALRLYWLLFDFTLFVLNFRYNLSPLSYMHSSCSSLIATIPKPLFGGSAAMAFSSFVYFPISTREATKELRLA